MAHIVAYNVPMARNMSQVTLGLDPNNALARNLQHMADSRHFTLRSMPAQYFIDTFFPEAALSKDRARYLPSRDAYSTVPAAAKTSQQIYEPLITALNERTRQQSRCPGFVFEDVAPRSPHPGRVGHMKPHICCFASESLQTVRHCDLSSRAELGYAELFFEVMPDPSHDFYTEAISLVATSQSGGIPTTVMELSKARGQHIAYVVEIFARQFREFFFSISMAGSRARLLRWDRSGCIVSDSFDIRTRPEVLCEFLWRFAQVPPAGRGHDITVEPALAEEGAVFEKLVTEATALQLGVKGPTLRQAVLQHYEPGRVMAVHVLDQDVADESSNVRRLLVSRPVVSPLSLCGKGTRGFWAVDTHTRRVTFLKDTWRSAAADREGVTLLHMAEVGVRNIPQVVAHGDVPHEFSGDGRMLLDGDYQSTRTDEFKTGLWLWPEGSKDIHVSQRRHYRIVLEPVGYDVRYLRGTEELLHASYDIFIAMQDALAKDSRVHRDISAGNIILVREYEGQTVRKGYLIDWESSCTVDESGLAVKAGRAGTWLFMSRAMLLDYHNKVQQTIKDDMESLLYVVLYCALHWLPHNLDKDALADIVAVVFEFRNAIHGSSVGGAGKLINAESRLYTGHIQFGDPAIKEWLDTVMDHMAPQPDQRELYKDKWLPEQLDAFWSEFLTTHKMAPNDRVYHDLTGSSVSLDASSSHSSDSESDSSVHSLAQVRPVRASQRLSNKRPLPATSESERARKTRSARSQPSPSEETPLRRSDRIRTQQARRSATAGCAPHGTAARATRGSAPGPHPRPRKGGQRPTHARPSRGRGGRDGIRGGYAARR
ncbi:hypothetical protein OH76DRAFT_1350143 [Lentinus brumalis]|uniref:Fungal-type protein kinase domain-containing protein n=1 Tax=Lentinus brumalis TaxID=2498619 RepID=A0A371DBE8_9APHY|nr:hypothetical protein OH76DRAFT_1350143 [Polyporus brumalis]